MNLYRVGVINDFINSYAYISYVDYGLAQHLAVCNVKGEMEPQQNGHAIHVFWNYKKVGVFQSKEEAAAMVRRMIAEQLPKQCQDWLVRDNLGIMESLNVSTKHN